MNDKHFKIRVYRITLTNVDGIIHEFSAREVQQWCDSRGLIPVEEFYYGPARDLYDIVDDENWNKNFISTIKQGTYIHICGKNNPNKRSKPFNPNFRSKVEPITPPQIPNHKIVK